MRLSGGTKTISLDWGQNGGYGSLKVTGDGTYGYVAFIADNPAVGNDIRIGDTIVITQGGNPYPSANVIGLYDTFSTDTVADPTLDWTGIKGIKLDNAFGLTGFQADVNIDGFVASQPKGLRITGNGIRLGGAPIIAGLFEPTGTPTSLELSDFVFEMGLYNFGDPGTMPDISGYNHSLGLNDNTSGLTNYYRFLNNSAQANDLGWPTAGSIGLTVMGWFAFASFSGATSLVTQTAGSAGWALRVDTTGTKINLVKYNVADQMITLDTPLTTNTWHFIGITQYIDSIYLNVDGTSYSITGDSSSFASDDAPVRLQYDPYNGGNQDVEMWMRDVKISGNGHDGTFLTDIWNAQKANYGY